jgi:hypothetical protein
MMHNYRKIAMFSEFAEAMIGEHTLFGGDFVNTMNNMWRKARRMNFWVECF